MCSSFHHVRQHKDDFLFICFVDSSIKSQIEGAVLYEVFKVISISCEVGTWLVDWFWVLLFCLMVPLMIVGLSVEFGMLIVFLSSFIQEREVGKQYWSFVIGVSKVLFWVQMSCCYDASLLLLGDSSTSFWVLFCWVLVTLCRFVVQFQLPEKFDNFFKTCSVCLVDPTSD